jgi:hypothetical protein
MEYKAAGDLTHCSRDKTLSATTYKEKEIEGDHISPIPGLLNKKPSVKVPIFR